jgi:hypothetical protein
VTDETPMRFLWLDRWRFAIAQRREVRAAIRVALAQIAIGDTQGARVTLEETAKRMDDNAYIFPGPQKAEAPAT